MISQTAPVDGRVEISFTLPRADLDKARRLVSGLRSEVVTEAVKLAVEGPGMEVQSGVAARFFQAMAGVGARIHSVTTSETKISCVIDRAAQARAVAAIKEAFRL